MTFIDTFLFVLLTCSLLFLIALNVLLLSEGLLLLPASLLSIFHELINPLLSNRASFNLAFRFFQWTCHFNNSNILIVRFEVDSFGLFLFFLFRRVSGFGWHRLVYPFFCWGQLLLINLTFQELFFLFTYLLIFIKWRAFTSTTIFFQDCLYKVAIELWHFSNF